MKPALALVFVLSLLIAPPLRAGESVVVVELFTSQGCSSCPPADAYLRELAAREGVLALALHVDYWDYIGWQDSFGQAAWSDRQRAYAEIGGRNWVYTPQMIINGTDDVAGSRPEDVEVLIRAHGAKAPAVTLNARRMEDTLQITAQIAGKNTGQINESASKGVGGPYLVQLFRYLPHQEVEISRGENAGRTLGYTNIVTAIDLLATWDGRSALAIEAPMAGKQSGMVIIQSRGPGAIIAATAVE